MSSVKYVYLFEEGKADMKMILGGKGANLADDPHWIAGTTGFYHYH